MTRSIEHAFAAAGPRRGHGTLPGLVCPACRAELATSSEPDPLGCGGCGRRFPVISGIPDLRMLPDPYLDIETDRARARELAERARTLGFEDLLRSYYAHNEAVPAAQAQMYTAGAIAAADRSRATRARWLEMEGGAGPGGPVLELGCGTGALLLACLEAGLPVVGLDIGLRWLVIARKRLLEAGFEAPLVCACAEALPFPADSFGAVAGESIIENVHSVPQALSEAGRVLVSGGRLQLSVPNAHSIGPDPQTGIWAAGWLPRAWIAAAVRRRGGVPPRRTWLTRRRIRAALGDAGFGRVRLGLPRLVQKQIRHLTRAARAAATAYGLAVRLAPSRWVLLRIGPTLLVTASRKATTMVDKDTS